MGRTGLGWNSRPALSLSMALSALAEPGDTALDPPSPSLCIPSCKSFHSKSGGLGRQERHRYPRSSCRALGRHKHQADGRQSHPDLPVRLCDAITLPELLLQHMVAAGVLAPPCSVRQNQSQDASVWPPSRMAAGPRLPLLPGPPHMSSAGAAMLESWVPVGCLGSRKQDSCAFRKREQEPGLRHTAISPGTSGFHRRGTGGPD